MGKPLSELKSSDIKKTPSPQNLCATEKRKQAIISTNDLYAEIVLKRVLERIGELQHQDRGTTALHNTPIKSLKTDAVIHISSSNSIIYKYLETIG